MNNNIDTKINELLRIVPDNLKKTVLNYVMCQNNLIFSNYVVLITIFLRLMMGKGFNGEWFIQILSIVVGLLIIIMVVCKEVYRHKLKAYFKLMKIKQFEVFDVIILLISVLLLLDTILSISI